MKRTIKIWIDVFMTCFLLFQMSYSLIGEERHKWHGIVLLILFVFHNILNRGFYKSLFRGSTARELHMVSAYWGFVILSLHLGLHWSMLLGMMKKKVPALQTKYGAAALRTSGILIAVYGVYGFIKRDIGLYMTLQNMFVFFDFEEPLVFFILDYLAVMGLFAWVGYYIAEWLKRFSMR